MVAVFLYSYWPTLQWMAEAWMKEPDYSHGWLVLPLAIVICYQRADRFPGFEPNVSWAGLSLVGLAIVMRLVGRIIYADFLDAWSILPLIAGAVWCLAGPRALRWALPAIVFLFFAIPMPYQAESMLSWQLQGIATDLSTILLRVFGQPAVAEGHMVWVGDEKLSIEAACSGLRIFVGMTAIAYFWAAVNDRSWLDRLVLMLAVIPAAVFVNSMRIVVTGLLYRAFEGESARHWIHDISGLLMIPASFVLLWAVGAYWKALYRPVEKMTAREFLKDRPAPLANSPG
ncbi:exosortase/archaeosortase family protein [Roseiconus nitratireducens]|uniref:Exosortase/archaeosortase family protein n=2 Tax=Roseiconus nitratireducens TaxID=2605748 RepID=A0A5M6DJC4_9BACT|nr:exosortase/archaeosortase family protein [Roseiconus nitratireducens]